jgi:hypothetical protein
LWKKLLLLFLFIFFTLAALSFASPAPFFRYLTQLIPVFCIITALIITSVVRSYFKTGVVIVFLLLTTVFVTDYVYQKLHPDKEGIKYLNFFDYIYEVTHDYDGPIEGIVKYLIEYGSKDDIVAITFGDLPIKFYTDMKVVGGWTDEDLSPAKRAKWVIMRKHILGLRDMNVRKYLLRNIRWEDTKQKKKLYSEYRKNINLTDTEYQQALAELNKKSDTQRKQIFQAKQKKKEEIAQLEVQDTKVVKDIESEKAKLKRIQNEEKAALAVKLKQAKTKLTKSEAAQLDAENKKNVSRLDTEYRQALAELNKKSDTQRKKFAQEKQRGKADVAQLETQDAKLVKDTESEKAKLKHMFKKRKDKLVSDYKDALDKTKKYKKVVIDYPDLLFENRESPWERHFKTVTGQDKVIIFQRIE